MFCGKEGISARTSFTRSGNTKITEVVPKIDKAASWKNVRHFKCSTCSSRDLKSLKQNLMEKENRSYTVYYPQNHLSKSGPQIFCDFIFIVFVFVFVYLPGPVEHSQHFSSYFYFPLHNFPKLLRNNYSNLWLYLILAFYRTSQRIMSASEKNIALCVLQIGKKI